MSGDSASSSFAMKWKHWPASLNCRRKAASGWSVRGFGQSRSGFVVVASAQNPGGWPSQPKHSGGREVAVVEEIAQHVGLRRPAVVALDEAAVDERLDDDVALAVEGRGAPGQNRQDESQSRSEDAAAIQASARASTHS